ncbi:MAG: DUF599 family protein [Promethearchaeia archaeon]
MIDEIAFGFFICCVSSYSILLAVRFDSKQPFKLTLYNMIYEGWVDHRLKKPDYEIATVQIFRNMIMANSTLITALFILLGILLGFYGSTNPGDGLIFAILGNYLIISVNVFIIMFCILNFIMSIRSINRCLLLITGNPKNYNLGEMNGAEAAKEAFIASKNHWMFGIRGLFFLVASMIWFINSILFFIATAIVTLYLILLRDIKRISIEQKTSGKNQTT